MVLAKHATINSQEWQKMEDYHPEGYPFRATLMEEEYQYYPSSQIDIPTNEIDEQLRKWRIGFKYEKMSGRYRSPGWRAYFFRTGRELMRMRLTFSEYITKTYQCKPRSQIEAERRREYRKKGKKDKTIMLNAEQLLSARIASKDEDVDKS